MEAVMVLLALAAAAWVLAPLRVATLKAVGSASGVGGQRERLRAAREAVDDAMRDLELDHATGKVSADDCRRLRAGYEARAAVIDRRAAEVLHAEAHAPQASGGPIV